MKLTLSAGCGADLTADMGRRANPKSDFGGDGWV